MILHAVLIWLAICVLAVANGVFREGVLKPRMGERMAHVVSTLLLSAAVFVVTFLSIGWIGPQSLGQAWGVGVGWVLVTLAFEFLAGHYVFKNPWEKIIGDYRVTRGRVWLLVPICTFFAPAMAYLGIATRYAVPYAVSLTIASAILLLSVSRPVVARWMVVLIFAYASVYNTWLGLTKPEEYQGFAELALLPWYRDFITGPFLASEGRFIVLIAIGQAIVAVTTALAGRWLWIGVVGTTLFLAGIAPLGLGGAFPFSAIVALAAWVCYGSDAKTNADRSDK
jgi:hypothetical protein